MVTVVLLLYVGLHGAHGGLVGTGPDHGDRTAAVAAIADASGDGDARYAVRPMPCNAAPSAGNVSPASSDVCIGATVVLASDADNGVVIDISYQWEQSLDGIGGWIDVLGGSGANSLSYTTAPMGTTAMYYRLKAVCDNTLDEAVSNVVSTTPDLAYAVFDGTLFTEGFEGPWLTRCGTTVPSVHWSNSPFSGQTAWRRSDVTTGMCGNSTGAFSPLSSTGAYGARARTSQSSAGQSNLDLFIDMSAATGVCDLRFDYMNADGPDFIQVFMSTDGGANFTQLGSDLVLSVFWSTHKFPFTTNSPTTVFRIRSGPPNCGNANDVAIDNLRVMKGCEGTPAAGAIAAPVTALCAGQGTTLTFNAGSDEPGITWTWQESATSGSGFTDVGTPDSRTLPVGPINQARYYRVVSTCLNSGLSSESAEVALDWHPALPPVDVTPVAQDACPGSPARLTATGGTSYSWNPSDYLNTTTGDVVDATVPFVGVFRYTVTGTAANGCTATATASVTGQPTPYNLAITPAVPPAICAGRSVDLAAGSGVIAEGTVGLPIASANDRYMPFFLAGTNKGVVYHFTAAQLNAAGITNGAVLTSISFEVTDLPEPAVLTNYQIKLANAALAVQGVPTAFSNPALGLVYGVGAYTVLPGVNSFHITPFTYTGGTITMGICYTAGGGTSPSVRLCDQTGNRGTMTAAGSICNGPSSGVSASQQAYYLPLTTFGYRHPNSTLPNLVWTPPTDLNPTTGPMVTATPPVTTDYTVTATYGACSATASVTVTVDPCLGIDGAQGGTFVRWHGQGADGSHLLRAEGTLVLGWEAFDATGRALGVRGGPVAGDAWRVHLGGTRSGAYFLRVRTDRGMAAVRMVHLER